MKKLIVIGIVATMVMGLAGAASAALDNTWMMQLRAYSTPDLQSSGTATFGTKVGAGDGFTTVASEDGVLANPTGTPGVIISTLVASQLTQKDVRAPLLVGETKTWNLVIYLAGGASGTIRLDGWMATGANMLDASTGVDPDIKLELKRGADVIWTVPKATSGTSLLPTFTQTFNFNGTDQVGLQFVASTVPEPGSMVALFSGLIGLVGFGIRRRK